MSAKKLPIRRYLLATLVGIVVGLVGVGVMYEYYCEQCCGKTLSQIDHQFVFFSEDLHAGGPKTRILAHVGNFIVFVLCDKPGTAVNILFGSTLLVPFAVYTFDAVAAAWKQRQGAVSS